MDASDDLRAKHRIALGDGDRVYLWGFGLCYHRADYGGIFMPRFTFAPQFTASPAPPDEVWSAAGLSNCRAPKGAAQWGRTRELFIPALRWIVAYERWILALRGPDYRRDCIAPWPHQAIAAERIIPEWEGTIDAIERQMATFIAARRPHR